MPQSRRSSSRTPRGEPTNELSANLSPEPAPTSADNDVPDSGDSSEETVTETTCSERGGRVELKSYAVLQERLKARFASEQLQDINRAFTQARDAHEGQTRTSGEPYILHPIAVAGIVLDMGLDHHSVMAALMHDVLEDTPVTRKDLVDAFGEEVTHIVDGVSKLSHMRFRTKAEAKAESFRKLLMAMVTDLRVILIKLADRLHNMRTIGALRPDKQRRIGKETLEVYAPIASRLGMYVIKTELEELSFKACYPMRYRVLQETVEQAHKNRDQVIGGMTRRIEAALEESGIEATVIGRGKHLYSLYNKMLKKQLPFQRVFDLSGLRVVVRTVDECYRALGIVHQMHAPIFTRFKDYIAVPKQNGYQSLHTVLNPGVGGIPVEVQIRTREMDTLAESGVAAHWAYEEGEANGARDRTGSWLNKLVDMQQSTSDTEEFIENVKIDLFPGEIYVFTPKGRIIQLPRNATPVDFAYAVHSQIGNTCVAAKVDRRLASLSVPLVSGQTVEIITGPKVAPSPMWLNSVVTAKARTAIRQHLRVLDRNKAKGFGERLLRRALLRYDMTPEDISVKSMQALLSEFRIDGVDELYVNMGLGLYLPSQIAERLVDVKPQVPIGEASLPPMETAPILITSPNETSLHLSKCCRPIPGDNVQGFFSAGKGIAVHRASCHNVRRFRRRPKEWVAVDWSPDTEGQFEVLITVHLANQPGALARVTSTMSLMNVNIENMDFNNQEDNVNIRFLLGVTDRLQLARIVRRLRNLTVVRSVKRVN